VQLAHQILQVRRSIVLAVFARLFGGASSPRCRRQSPTDLKITTGPECAYGGEHREVAGATRRHRVRGAATAVGRGWAREDLNLRPHAYQATTNRARFRQLAGVSRRSTTICWIVDGVKRLDVGLNGRTNGRTAGWSHSSPRVTPQEENDWDHNEERAGVSSIAPQLIAIKPGEQNAATVTVAPATAAEICKSVCPVVL